MKNRFKWLNTKLNNDRSIFVESTNETEKKHLMNIIVEFGGKDVISIDNPCYGLRTDSHSSKEFLQSRSNRYLIISYEDFIHFLETGYDWVLENNIQDCSNEELVLLKKWKKENSELFPIY